MAARLAGADTWWAVQQVGLVKPANIWTKLTAALCHNPYIVGTDCFHHNTPPRSRQRLTHSGATMARLQLAVLLLVALFSAGEVSVPLTADSRAGCGEPALWLASSSMHLHV